MPLPGAFVQPQEAPGARFCLHLIITPLPGGVKLDDVALLRPPGVQAQTVNALAKPFIVGLLPRFWEILQLVSGVVISPNTLCYLSVLRPMWP